MIKDGRWQAMTTAEQEGIMRQATQGHMSLDGIGKLATQAGVRKVVLSHLTRRTGNEDYEPWAEEVRKHFSGEVVVAEDLMEF
jgi:ribonuclease BN (tRNA processing enzyme)